MKKVILFDFFGVISSEVAPKWFARFFNDSEAKRIKDEICIPGDLGQCTEEELMSRAAQVCGTDVETLRETWYDLAIVDKEMVEYIKNLHKSHPVYLLSNAVDTFLKTIIYKNGLEDLFDRIFISSEIRLAKPDPAFFKHCLNEIKVDASECVMIDDNPKNIAAAESVGIKGIVYKDLTLLKNEIERT